MAISGVNAIRMNGISLGGGGGGLSFAALPVTGAAVGTNDFVVEFDAAGDTDNETGVSGATVGLTGADLVFTQTGSPPADGTKRQIVDNSTDAFSPTIAWYNKFFQNTSGFSMLWQLEDLTSSTAGTYLALVQSVAGPQLWLPTGRGFAFYDDAANVVLSLGAAVYKLTTPGTVFMLLSVDYTNDFCFWGVSEGADQPTEISDFTTYSYNLIPQSVPPAITSFNSGRSSIIGSNGLGGSVGCYIKSITASLTPSVTVS